MNAQDYAKKGENFAKSGDFRQAGDMYLNAAISTKNESQKSAYFSKAEENYSKAGENFAKSGDFRQAGDMYRHAAFSTEDKSQKSHYQSKAIENYVKAIWLQQGSDLQAAIDSLAKISSPAIQALTTLIRDPKMVSMRNNLLDALGTARAKAPGQNNIPTYQFSPGSLDLKKFPTGNPFPREIQIPLPKKLAGALA